MKYLPSILSFSICSLLFFTVATAESVDVQANIPSGTYSAPIRVELSTTESGGKTFYSFKPDGYPQDALLYTGAILLKKTTPLVFFTVISTTNESKIKQNDYVFSYSSDIRFVSPQAVDVGVTQIDVTLQNTSQSAVDIGYWQVLAENGPIEIPEGTKIDAGGTYVVHNVPYTGNGHIVLHSPDDEERAILEITRSEPVKAATIVTTPKPPKHETNTPKKEESASSSPATPATTSGTTETPIPSPVSSVPPTEHTSSSVPTPQPSSPAPEITTPAPSVTPAVPTTESVAPAPPTPVNSLNDTIKSSALESGNGAVPPIYIAILFIFLAGIAGVRFWFARKKA